MKDFFENLLSNGELQEKVAELQGKIDAYQMSENEANEIIAELKAENEQLKEVNQSLSMLGTDLASANETVRKEFFRADKNKDMWREKAENLQQTLQEIKKIAEIAFAVCDDDCGNANRFTEILDLITKAEEE